MSQTKMNIMYFQKSYIYQIRYARMDRCMYVLYYYMILFAHTHTLLIYPCMGTGIFLGSLLSQPRWAKTHGPKDHVLVKRILKDAGLESEEVSQEV